MQTPIVVLLLGVASAQTSPNIADLLSEASSSSQPGHIIKPLTAPVSENSPGSIGSALGVTVDKTSGSIKESTLGYSAVGVSNEKQSGGQRASSQHTQVQTKAQGHEGEQGSVSSEAVPQTPVNAASMMSSLLGRGNLPQHNGASGASGTAQISSESSLIVSGLVEAFMHKVHLLPGEKTCLEHNVAELASDVVATGQDVVSAIKAMIPHGQEHPGVGPGIKMDKHTQGTLTSSGMDGALKLTSLVGESTSLMKNCVQGDALAMLNATARHFINMSYVGHRLLVSGVDIAHSLSDGIIAFEKHQYRRFGADIGNSIRRVLLSNATNGTKLPEGIPEQSIIQQTSEGIMDGFFVSGSSVEITDAAEPDVDIKLNLHQCIAGNQNFFKEIFLALWSFIAQLSANAGQHGFQNPFTSTSQDGGQPKWMGELMLAMMQFPTAISKCRIGANAQQMLLEAIQSIQYWKIDVEFPRYKMNVDEITKRMALAIDKWTIWDFEDFGIQVGKLLREFVLMVLPEAYSVDAHGRLRRQLIGQSAGVGIAKAGQPFFSPFFLAFGGVALSLLVMFVAVRGLRMAKRQEYSDASAELDSSQGSDVELATNLMEVE